jgi:hypothetical protein
MAERADYERYKQMKSEWVARNTGATEAQYVAAMQLIAKLCGV